FVSVQGSPGSMDGAAPPAPVGRCDDPPTVGTPWAVPTGRADAGDAPTASAAGTAAVQTPETSGLRRERDGAAAPAGGEYRVIAGLRAGPSHPAASARPNQHYLDEG